MSTPSRPWDRKLTRAFDNVPVGLEIKTCRDQLRVDCHHPHAGLHLALVLKESNRTYVVNDLCVGFLQSSDYHEAGRNTSATTVKYSFNRNRFVSLLPA
ncbi:MAG: hypothetical protein KGM43_06210 [Planctomycetota bacterium]|nr:hypothetical protein [Planctomycetota bacterium]